MRLILRSILIASLACTAVVSAGSVEMIFAEDLRHESKLAKDNNLVLVLEFQSEYCEYCMLLEEGFLLPMQRSQAYRSKVLIRSVSMDSHASIIDFDGRPISTSKFAYRYNVTVTPTLIFLDANGVEISDKLVGIWSEDYFGGYIDERIDEARTKL